MLLRLLIHDSVCSSTVEKSENRTNRNDQEQPIVPSSLVLLYAYSTHWFIVTYVPICFCALACTCRRLGGIAVATCNYTLKDSLWAIREMFLMPLVFQFIKSSVYSYTFSLNSSRKDFSHGVECSSPSPGCPRIIDIVIFFPFYSNCFKC